MRYAPLTLLLLSGALFIPNIANGQLQILGGEANNITISTRPLDPGPNQFVTAVIESFATDLDRAAISWFLNNKLEKEGVGLKTLLFKTGALGSLSNISVIIKTSDGTILQQVLNVRPTALDLIWEAQSYTPPFYRGKALYPFQGTVKLVALPNVVTDSGALIDSKNLIYTWKVDGDTVAKLGGYGKNFIFFNGSIPLGPATIEVEAASLDNKYATRGEATLSPQASEVLLYEDHPLYGVLSNKALRGNVSLQNEEIKLAGIPYFIGVAERDNTGLTYEWQLNNRVVAGGNKSSLSFKQGLTGGGTALVALQVSNPAKIFQFAGNNLSLTFGKASGSNLFGTQ